MMRFETEQEVDGRWIAEIPDLPGVMAYGETEEEAKATAQVLAEAYEQAEEALELMHCHLWNRAAGGA